MKLHKTLHPTNFLKLVDKMYQYEIDPASIVEDREHSFNVLIIPVFYSVIQIILIMANKI